MQIRRKLAVKVIKKEYDFLFVIIVISKPRLLLNQEYKISVILEIEFLLKNNMDKGQGPTER